MFKQATNESGGMITVSPLYPNEDVLTVIGEACFLCFHSKVHQHWSMKNIGRLFEPPIYLKQFHVYRAGTIPRGLVTWAKLDSEAEAKHISGAGLDDFDEWRSGSQFWIMDFMAPWGHGKHIINDILTNFEADDFKTLRVHNGRRSIVHWQREGKGQKWGITTQHLD